MADDDGAKKKKRSVFLNRDIVMRRLHLKQQGKKASPMTLLKDIFEETDDKDRFVGDIMFWKYFEDIDIDRIYHTNSVEYRNLKVMFFETVFYFFLMASITVYAYQLQSQDVFEGRIEQLNYWSGCDPRGNCKLQKVEDIGSFWSWMEDELVPLAYTEDQSMPTVAQIETLYDNSDFPLYWSPRYIGTTRSNILLGALRMRQLRVQPNVGCSVSKLMQHVYPDCYATYAESRESQEAFDSRFAPTYLKQAYTWAPIDETKQTSVRGKSTIYSGAGYFADLPANKSHATAMLKDLHEWRWIDKLTRGIVVELTTLNTNVDVIVNTVIIFEFSPNGAVTGTVTSNAVRIFMFTPSLQAGQSLLSFVCMIQLWCMFIFFLLWTFWLMFKTTLNFIGKSPVTYLQNASWSVRLLFPFRIIWQFYRYGWNVADMVILSTFFLHMSFRIGCFLSVQSEPSLLPDVIGHPEEFMPFARLIEPLTSGNQILALLAITCWIKLFKYLCMSSYFRLLVRILEKCASRLVVFAAMLLIVFFGFAVAFSIGLGNQDENLITIQGSFLVLFFLLIDGFAVDQSWFEPGKDQAMPIIFLLYIFLIYFVLLNIFIAVVLDTYSLASRTLAIDPDAQNPMMVFLETYFNWMKGQSLVKDDAEENMKLEDLAISVELLPGLVRRKWVEKKRRMQRVADQNFAGMVLFPEEDKNRDAATIGSDWMLPSTQTDVFEQMTNAKPMKPIELYDIPEAVVSKELSRAQLQRLMDEDATIPLLLGSKRAVDVIRKFKQPDTQDNAGEVITAVKSMQGEVFSRIDKLEQVKLDEDVPRVPEIDQITEQMSGAVTDVRNQFRVQLTGVIEATAMLFEHLVELTQGLEEVRLNNDGVIQMVRNNADQENEG